MERRPLGRSDLLVSRVGLGCNNFGRRSGPEQTRAVIDAALDAGVTFFDTADVYGNGASERFIGTVLSGRDVDVVIATKFGMDMQGANGDAPRGSREYMRRSVDASLARLGRDQVDLLYYHRPDGITPVEETVGAMSELVGEGKVRWLAISNADEESLRRAAAEADRLGTPIVAVQNRFSLMHRDDEEGVLALARSHSIGYVPYFPLEMGLLTGKYRRGEEPPQGARLSDAGNDRIGEARLAQVEELAAFGAGHGLSLLELAIGGLASFPGIASVIAGATSAEQVRANAAAGAASLDVAALDELRALV
jgi:aryl-alcohol dehydrogenase-like predicted oxidoreductase